ncbi:MAG: helix-turn-helix domain-containing protein [Candidatus Methanomethylicia archaeon]
MAKLTENMTETSREVVLTEKANVVGNRGNSSVTRMTGEKLKVLIDLHAKGLSFRKIARELGVNHKTIGYWCRKLGLKPNYTRRSARSDLDKEINKIISLYEQGLSTKSIAEMFNVSPPTIYLRLKKAGIKLRSRGVRGRREEALKYIINRLSMNGAMFTSNLARELMEKYKYGRAYSEQTIRLLVRRGFIKSVFVRHGRSTKSRLSSVLQGIIGKRIVWIDDNGLAEFLTSRLQLNIESSRPIKKAVTHLLRSCGVPENVIEKLRQLYVKSRS